MEREGCYVDFEPIGRRVPCRPGVDLLTLARDAGISISAVCGGKGTCGRCRVVVMEGEVSPLSATERRALKGDADAGYRLACQTVVHGPAKVHVPATSLTSRQRTQVEGKMVQFALDPPVRAVGIALSDPALTDLRSDAVRVRDYLRQEEGVEATYDVAVLRQLSDRLRQEKWLLRAVLRDDEVVALLPAGESPLGLAFDLGTTKIAGYLVDMETGETLAAEGAMNPQISYGEDVMARIAYALEGAEQAEALHQAAVTGLADLAQTLCQTAGADPERICEAVVVGNTAMHHLFLGLPVRQLGNAPYLAVTSDALDVKARDVGWDFVAPGAYVHLLPNIAGFVGADHVAMILATGLYQAKETTIALDIGTNTEIALYHDGRLVSCSTASGPAFEGAHIRFGMRAIDGAIERVAMDDHSVRYQTINDCAAVGICGSGILDAVAQLYRAGVLDMKGGMSAENPLVREAEGGREFVLVPASASGVGEDIVVTRNDVGQIQLAKGAMRSGINVLLQEVGIQAKDIQRFIVAGAFGSYIDVQSAIDIAMFPELPLERFQQVGNAAGAGARMALLSREARRRAVEIATVAHYIELTNEPRFVQEFMTAMFLTDLS